MLSCYRDDTTLVSPKFLNDFGGVVVRAVSSPCVVRGLVRIDQVTGHLNGTAAGTKVRHAAIVKRVVTTPTFDLVPLAELEPDTGKHDGQVQNPSAPEEDPEITRKSNNDGSEKGHA